jgi:phosphoserine aminotransferase
VTWNFLPGPAVLPRAVLEEAAAQLVDFQGSGMSILEMSHRGGLYEAVHQEALECCRRLAGIPNDLAILFLQGGASTQFAMAAMNLLRQGRSADYLITGHWAQRALEEARILGRQARVAGSSEPDGFRRIPTQAELDLDPGAEYVHLTTNNTIYGTQYAALPDTGQVWIAADLSSDLLSRPIPWERIGLAYGGAQKNAGIAGLTLVFVRQELLARETGGIPTMLRYSTHLHSNSLYNTPPVFAVYVFSLVLRWIEAQGGLPGIDALNRRKAAAIYQVLDELPGFYCGHAEPGSRSLMNITFTLADRSLEPQFCVAAEAQGLVGLRGHRSLGGVRASLYNAMEMEGCRVLAEFMRDYARRHG